MSFGHSLYYPHINLTNKNWIKQALLFWDKLSRIVPDSITPSDNEDIIRIKYDTDFIIDYSPDNRNISDTFRNFGKHIEKIIHSDEFYHDRYFHREFRRYRERYDSDINFRRDFYEEIVRNNGTYLHIQKIDHRLKENLFRYGLAIPGRNEWEDWIKIDNEIGYLYMTYLAKSISKSKSLSIVTDTEYSFSSSIFFEPKIYRDYNSEFEYKLGNLLIESQIPKNINNVPIEKIIEIREKYKDERNNFFILISDLANVVQEIDNETALKDALNLYSKKLLKETKNLRKLYKSFKIESVSRFLTISMPSSLTALSSFVPSEYKPAALTAGIGFGLISAVNCIEKDKSALKENQKSYLLNINSELNSKNLFKKINDTVIGLRRW